MDANWTYVLSRLTFQLTIFKFHSIKQSTEEYNRTLRADQALLSMETYQTLTAQQLSSSSGFWTFLIPHVLDQMLLIAYIKRAIQHQYCDRTSEIDNIGIIEKCEDFKRESSEEQNWPKITRTELLNLRQSHFCSIRRIYHELREKEEALQNVKDPNVRKELESEFEEESASTKRHTIGVMRLIGKLFLWKMTTLTILCEGLMNRVLYVVTAYCFTWWTCGHAAQASAASMIKFVILKLKISTARNKAVFLFKAKNLTQAVIYKRDSCNETGNETSA
ncbi:hypothetical protein T03_10054 [Trichinella britovi]|uniref:Uncharacterized protein n=1 Tax=Trichinella britovi TaxID=45882 RepID=A0A0V1C6A6_TRIBR|nr:hypothetical protein T03_10054 [Trichinella britovi]